MATISRDNTQQKMDVYKKEVKKDVSSKEWKKQAAISRIHTDTEDKQRFLVKARFICDFKCTKATVLIH